jgi:hypothetical protein
MRVALITLLVLGVAGAGVTAAARADSNSTPLPAKASSLAPRGHSANRSYGAPIQPRILSHSYRKPRRSAATGSTSRS